MIAREYPSFSQAELFPSFSQASNCFITFEYNNGLPAFVLELAPGKKIPRPGVPHMPGYQFEGWFLETGNEWNFDSVAGGDNITLNAKWEARVFYIDYHLNGGRNDGLNPNSYTVRDENIVLKKAVRGDDEFIAWYEDATFSRYPVEVIHTSLAQNIFLYARFQSKQKTVTAIEPATDKHEGEPKLFLTPDGANLCYEAGQPVMERGLENHALISLFTLKGWCGNVFLSPKDRMEGDFEETCSGPITRSKLADIEDAAVRALSGKAFPHVGVNVQNPKSDNLRVEITVKGGGSLSLNREGALWKNQRART